MKRPKESSRDFIDRMKSKSHQFENDPMICEFCGKPKFIAGSMNGKEWACCFWTLQQHGSDFVDKEF